MTYSSYTLSQRMLDAAISAYAIQPDVPANFFPDLKYWDPIGAASNPILFSRGSYDTDAGFLVTTQDNWIVLSLRGTLSGFSYTNLESFISFILDWWEDDETRLVPMFIGRTMIGNVHKGFLEAAQTLWSAVAPHLFAIDWSKYNGLLVTGHSKGAALAPLMAAFVKGYLGGGNGPKQMQVYGYAMPLAGDPMFAAWYRNNGLDACTTRYQRAHDIVPFVPPYQSWNIFQHLTSEPGNWDAWLLCNVLKDLGDGISTGYELIGSPIFYTGQNPVGLSPVTGPGAITGSQAAILAAVYYGHGEEIAKAHSAVHSYWPALFQQPNPELSLDELTAKVEAELVGKA
ncbi:MAG: lipase family protein [Sphingomonadaceae bacterium]|nr:lipase family protein [Sphingomonadaceae bacterium]MCP5383678.1 lipase family protein [Altererythrobacter sp.]MCP5392032.1 lipase family protein [Sphingomonadaceae bacterium]MCP5394989.1 lipase family protein [Sphingomonadaceae bacterium]